MLRDESPVWQWYPQRVVEPAAATLSLSWTTSRRAPYLSLMSESFLAKDALRTRFEEDVETALYKFDSIGHIASIILRAGAVERA